MLVSPMTYSSIFTSFEATAQRYPDRPFLNVLRETAQVYAIDAGEISCGQMYRRAGQLKNAYADAGYGPGHRVGVLVENRPAYFEHWFALNALGVSIVPVNPDLRASELAYLVEHSEMALAIAIPARVEDLLEAGKSANLPVIEPDGAIPTAIKAATPALPNHQTEAALLYTSGTTGLPKGCVLTNEYFLNCGDWYQNVGGACALHEDGERMLTPLPLFHMNAMACSTMAMISVGGCLSVLDRFHPTTWWQSVRESRASIIHYLGVMPAMLMNTEPDVQDKDHGVRFGFGAGVEKQLHVPFEERFDMSLVEAWAMTETGNGAIVITAHGDRHVGTGCFGRPTPDVEVRLVDEDGKDVATGEIGELLVRRAGKNPKFGFFDRYLKNEEETAKAWEGGWFHTGDVVRRNTDGTLVFVDRTSSADQARTLPQSKSKAC